MPSPDSKQKDLDKNKAKTSFTSRLAIFDAVFSPVLGIGKNLFETSKAVFEAVLGKLTFGLETLSDSLTKLSIHGTNMGIASAALNGIETVLLSPLSFYLRYKDKQANQESMSWHSKAKFVYGLVVFAATIFAMAFPPAAIATNIVVAASGVVASGVSLYRNIKRRLAANEDYKPLDTESQVGTEQERNGLEAGLKHDKVSKAPDNSKIAHKVFGVLLAIAGVVAVGLAATGGGLLIAAGIMGAVIAALSTVQMLTKIGEAIYKARSGVPSTESGPVNNPDLASVHSQQVVESHAPAAQAVATQKAVSSPHVQANIVHQDVSQPASVNEQQSPANEVMQRQKVDKAQVIKPVPSADEMKQTIREAKQTEPSMGTGLSGLGRIRF